MVNHPAYLQFPQLSKTRFYRTGILEDNFICYPTPV
jgi:hypothetical protein